MPVSHCIHHMGGTVAGKAVSGNQPLPWVKFGLVVHDYLYSSHGKRILYSINHCVVVQGRENVDAILPWLDAGQEIYVVGKAAYLGDVCRMHFKSEAKDNVVTLAILCQPAGLNPQPVTEK